MKIPIALVGLLCYFAVARSAESRVLVIPFAQIADSEKSAWIAPAIQQSLLSEFTRWREIKANSAAAPVAILDAESATKAAKTSAADIVIYGSYQVIDTDIRITAQVLDIRIDKQLGSLRATGRVRDLFELEDILTNQARRLIIPPVQNEPNIAPHPAVSQPETVSYWRQPPRRTIYGMDDYNQATYRRFYSYGYWYPGWGCYGGYWGGCLGGCWGSNQGNLTAWHGGW